MNKKAFGNEYDNKDQNPQGISNILNSEILNNEKISQLIYHNMLI